jgi:hypothetical protein
MGKPAHGNLPDAFWVKAAELPENILYLRFL